MGHLAYYEFVSFGNPDLVRGSEDRVGAWPTLRLAHQVEVLYRYERCDHSCVCVVWEPGPGAGTCRMVRSSYHAEIRPLAAVSGGGNIDIQTDVAPCGRGLGQQPGNCPTCGLRRGDGERGIRT